MVRSYTKAYLSSDMFRAVWKPAPGEDILALTKVAILRNSSTSQAVIYYNELIRPDGTNVCANWVPFDADGNILFGGRSGLDMAQRYFPTVEYRFHPKN